MKRKRDTHLTEGLEVVGEYVLNQLKIKGLVEAPVWQKLRTLSVTQQIGVLENSKRILSSGTKLFCRLIRKSYRPKLICKQHVVVFLCNAVDDDHD